MTGFGLATLVFALSTSFWLSAVALFATGAFDSVSVIIRSTILQVFPPDHLRGRVQAVNSVFASASLPLSADNSGAYTDQIYMGVFRPDGQGNARWLGNLKQYKFAVDANLAPLVGACGTDEDEQSEGCDDAHPGYAEPLGVVGVVTAAG